ncbi:helix-turn-helix transcriptional regulator [Kocuria salina]|uniref:helix-turn-helix domain-containing protein n=1 Tax=Kocuria salina TaxID=1929416 RepID=UPI001592B02C|nr:helix-turn-helix transcriptional regulator [Kocuria salina]NVC23366.1 helix-turn-helix transcriptional regulator [Kocuria salina]
MSIDKMHQSPNHPAVRLARNPVRPGLSPEARRYVGDRIAQSRRAHGYSRGQVAAALCINDRYGIDYVARLEAGEVELTEGRAAALKKKLGIAAPMFLAVAQQYDATPWHERIVPAAPRSWPGLPPAKPRTAADRRVEAIAVLGAVVGALFVVASLITLVVGHTGAAATAGVAGWLALSWPLALAGARAMDNRNRRG